MPEFTSEPDIVAEGRLVFDGSAGEFDDAGVSECVLDTTVVTLGDAVEVELAEPTSNEPLGDALDFLDAELVAQSVTPADAEDCAEPIADKLGDALSDALAVPSREGTALAELDEAGDEERDPLEVALKVTIEDSVELDDIEAELLGPTEAIAVFVFTSQSTVDDGVAEARIENVGVDAAESVTDRSEDFEDELDELGDLETLADTEEVVLARGLGLSLPVGEGDDESENKDGDADIDVEPLSALLTELDKLARALALDEADAAAETVRDRDAESEAETRGDRETETLPDDLTEGLWHDDADLDTRGEFEMLGDTLIRGDAVGLLESEGDPDIRAVADAQLVPAGDVEGRGDTDVQLVSVGDRNDVLLIDGLPVILADTIDDNDAATDLEFEPVTASVFEMGGEELGETDTIGDFEDDGSLDRDLVIDADTEFASGAVWSADGDGERESDGLPLGDTERRADEVSEFERDGLELSDTAPDTD